MSFDNLVQNIMAVADKKIKATIYLGYKSRGGAYGVGYHIVADGYWFSKSGGILRDKVEYEAIRAICTTIGIYKYISIESENDYSFCDICNRIETNRGLRWHANICVACESGIRREVREKILTEERESRREVARKLDGKCSVYILESGGSHKIGISSNVGDRVKTIQTSISSEVNKVYSKQFRTRNIATKIERELHSIYHDKRLKGEWFSLKDGDVESAIDYIRNYKLNNSAKVCA